MKSNPLVTIIITNYNYEKLLPRAIESCLSQDYKNIEIVIVDDHSTDNSAKVIHKFLRKYPNIKFGANQSNRGPNYTWNKALSLSAGEFVCSLDADDYLPPNSITTRLNILLASNFDAVMTGLILKSDNSEATIHPVDTANPKELADFLTNHKQHLINTLNSGINTVTCMWRTAKLKQIGWRRPKEFKNSSDYELGLRTILKLKTAVIDQPTYVYNTHPNSVLDTSRKNKKEINMICKLEKHYLLRNHKLTV